MVVFETVHHGELVRVRREGARMICEALTWTEKALPAEIMAHVVRAVAQEQQQAPERVRVAYPPSRGELRIKRRVGVGRRVAEFLGVL